MRFFVGTSGYSYKEWKGIFYPEKLPQSKMLSCYAERFATVEISNSFLRHASSERFRDVDAASSARLSVRAQSALKIAHHKRLKNVAEEIAQLLQAASVL
jgi:uncharacterized protein YecE (DUF72 family)